MERLAAVPVDIAKAVVVGRGWFDSPIRARMHAAFAVASSLSPRPDNIILLVDGMPTMDSESTDKRVVGAVERGNIFRRAVRELPGGVPINVMLFPMEGDFDAPISFWSLALTTRGSFLTVSRDWP